MTFAQLNNLLDGLPHGLKQQIIGYVRAVQEKLPHICEEAGVILTGELESNVLMIATIRKLNGIVLTAYWTTDNCLDNLQRANIDSFRIGATTYQRDSVIFDQIQGLRTELDTFIREQDLTALVFMPYQDVVKVLARE